MDLIKYDMTDIWASAGDVVAPDSTKINQGWGVEIVPRQWWNWFENRQDNNLAYMLQKGIPEWDATTEYIINKSYVQRNGTIYRASATSTNSDPIALTSWVKAFVESAPYLELLKALSVSNNTMPYIDGTGVAQNTATTAYGRSILNVVDADAARTLIAAQVSHANLTGLSSVSGSANNLPYFTGSGNMAVTTFTGFARSLLDDADATAMRATLGLGTAALANITTSDLDTTTGRLTKVGDFGIGAGGTVASKYVPAWPNTSLNDLTGVGSGIYRTIGSTTDVINGNSAIVIYAMQNSDAVRATQLTFSTAGGATGNNMIFRSCDGGTLAAPVWSTNEDMASKAEVYAQMAEFGLATPSAPIITDLNDATVGGFNRFAGGSTANVPPQIVGSVSGIVQTLGYGTGYKTQLVITLQTTDATKYNRLFTRTMNSGTWGTWKEYVNSDVLATTLADYALKGANTDITSLSSVTLSGTTTLGTTVRTTSADSTTVPSSGGSLVTPAIRLSDNAASAKNVLALQGYSFTTGDFGSTIVGTRSSGVIGAQGAVATGKSVLTLLGAASDGTKYNPIARIDYYTAEAQTTTAAGGEIRFLTTPLGSLVPALAATITSSKNLYVVGAINAASATFTAPLPVASGGTGSSTASGARTNLQAVGYDTTTGSATLPAGTTAQRSASPTNGQIRYNSETNEFEGYQNGAWAGIGGGTPLYTVLWWPNRASIPAGYIPADGQLLTRTSYQAAFAGVNSGILPVVSDATWLATSTSRGCYTTGNGTTTFRIPDLNGKTAGTTAAPFLRGDGTNSTGVAGQFQGSANLSHNHAFVSGSGAVRNTYPNAVGYNLGPGGSYADLGTPAIIDVSGGVESRPVNVTGVFVIKLIGGASELSQDDASVAVAALEDKLQFVSGRNRIINGDARVSQKATVTASAGVNAYGGVDRFRATNAASAGGSFTQSRSSSLVFDGVTRQAVRHQVVTAIANTTGGNYWGGINQLIEGLNCFDFVGKPIVTSFIFNTNVSGTYSVSLADSGGTKSYVSTFVAVANTPLKVELTAIVPTDAVLPNTTEAGLQIRIGATNTGTFQTSSINGWQAGNFISATGATNWGSTAGNFIEVTDLQIELGTQATEFERLNISTQIAQCQRYYVAGSGVIAGYNLATGNIITPVDFKSSMRVIPSVVVGQSATNNMGTVNPTAQTVDGFAAYAPVTATGNSSSNFSWTANAEI